MDGNELPAGSTTASDPGMLSLSDEKLRRLEPGMFGMRRVLRKIGGMLLIVDVFDMVDKKTVKESLAFGDSRAAMVVAVTPLLVAAYSDDLDCVAMLRFPDEFVRDYGLSVGSRLLTVNNYYNQLVNQRDLTFGPGYVGGFSGFFPLIGEFLSDDIQRIEQRKSEISEAEWQRCCELGEAYLMERPGTYRYGRPRRAHQPAGFMMQIIVGVTIGIIGIAAFIVLAWMFL